MRETIEVGLPDEIADCTDPRSVRYALGSAQITPNCNADGECFVASTDGEMLAVARCEGEVKGEMLIPRVMQADDGGVKGKFPPLERAMPEVDESYIEVTLNIGLLLKAVKMIGDNSEYLTLFVPNKHGDAVVIQGEHGIGAVMPVDDGTRGLETFDYNQTRQDFLDSRQAVIEKPQNKKGKAK